MDTRVAAKDEIICQCFQVSEQTIRDCIASKDLTSIEDVTRACEAGGGCHSCHILIELFLEEHQHKPTSMDRLVATHGPKVKKRGILKRFFSRFKSNPSPS